MAIRFCREFDCETVPVGSFSIEKELEDILAKSPELLSDDQGPSIAFVDRQISLPKAGILDLLFVDSDGLPIAVEVKKGSNPEARREVIGQVIDYLSSLTALTVDELDQLVNGKLETALRDLADDADDPEFDRVWQAVGANLRAGQARLVVALDEAPPAALERIFRFLARNSEIDVQLLTVERYSSPKMGEVFVPRIVVNPATESQSVAQSPKLQYPEFEAAVDAYNRTAPPDAQATGLARSSRIVRPRGWPVGMHYLFWRKNKMIMAIRLWIKSSELQFLDDVLAPFAGKPVANGHGNLRWDPDSHKLGVDIPFTEPPETSAHAMQDLIDMTRGPLTEALSNGPW